MASHTSSDASSGTSVGLIWCGRSRIVGLARIARSSGGGRAPELHHPSAFARYGNWLQKRPWLMGSIALIVMLVIAIPMLSLRLGFSDDGGTAPGTPPRIAYDLTAEGFGPGVNGPFYIAVQLPEAGDQEAVTQLTEALMADPGVALAAAPPVAEDADVVPIQLYPTTAPQDEATTDLLFHIRDDIIPAVEADTGAQAYVGGFQAVTVDFTKVLTDALPWFLLIVVGPWVPGDGRAVPIGGRCRHRSAVEPAFAWRPRWVSPWRSSSGAGSETWSICRRPVRSSRSCRSWCSRSCSGSRVTTRCSWSVACTRSGCTPTTTARRYVAGWPALVGWSRSLRPS